METVAIFPEEVWFILLTKLPPVDAHSCSKVCTTFEKLLAKRRTSLVTSLALPILLENQLATEHTALRWRLVCHDWNSTVVTYWRSLDYHLNRQEVAYSLKWRYHFNESEKMIRLRFMAKFGDEDGEPVPRRHWNPFPFGFVTFSDKSYYSRKERLTFWLSCKKFLDSFGSHVLHCEVDNGCGVAQHMFGEVVLAPMPNLKSLSVRFYERAGTDYYRPAESSNCGELCLPHLFKLKLEAVDRPMVASLLRAADPSTLKHVELEYCRINVGKLTKMFTNLEDFRLLYFPCSPLTPLRESSWPLERFEAKVPLSSKWYSYPKSERVTLDFLFDTLNNFGKTLVVVKLELLGKFVRYNGKTEEQKNWKLTLPRLQELRLALNQGVVFETLDFVQDLKNLRILQILNAEPSANDDKRYKEIREQAAASWIQTQIVETSLWQRMPKLRAFSFVGLAEWPVVFRVAFQKFGRSEEMVPISTHLIRRSYAYKGARLASVDKLDPMSEFRSLENF